MKKILFTGSLILVLAGAVFSGIYLDRRYFKPTAGTEFKTQNVLNEENVVINVADKVSPSVVTIGISKTTKISFNSPFGIFRNQIGQDIQDKQINEDIGSGFVISKDGLIATNKHVVDDTEAKYRVITSDDKEYSVQKIYRDPANDLAILKIDSNDLTPIEMGDSGKLKVGQFVVAIGTALGEFRHTVTTGVVSGLGRGISAGSPFDSSAEHLDDVIQTDAAINPGNSGGPLLNSLGQAIGINTAVSAMGQNIGFAIPINVIKEAIDNFNKTGQFNRPYLGVRYRMLDMKTALQYEVPAGAYVQDVVADSPAAKAGISEGDIITKIGGVKIDGSDEAGLSKAIASKKVGEKIEIEFWRDGENKKESVTLEEAK